MGIDIDGKMMVGKEYGDIDFGDRSESEIREFIEDFLHCASPWYDADIEYWFIGKEIPNTSIIEIDKFYKLIDEAIDELKPLIGEDLIIWGGQNVW